jgi:hypothetical protein
MIAMKSQPLYPLADDSQEQSVLSTFLFNPVFTTVLAFVLDRPLFQLFMFGPALWGWGFHEGKEHSLICAEYTGITELHWLQAPYECEALIMRKFNALLVTLHFSLYMTLVLCTLWSVCGCALFYCCSRHFRRTPSTPRKALCYRCAVHSSFSRR